VVELGERDHFAPEKEAQSRGRIVKHNGMAKLRVVVSSAGNLDKAFQGFRVRVLRVECIGDLSPSCGLRIPERFAGNVPRYSHCCTILISVAIVFYG
jgi:hypothetical protein